MFKLIDRNFPVGTMRVFLSWYSVSYVWVRMDDATTDNVDIYSGVKQGRIICPQKCTKYMLMSLMQDC